ncbi:dipeptidyl peptidase 9 [Plutella xylostella]|uniref:dipeptidyl peptidase 9 n=1 Tax=Plutella xylostella TaxID=51655 RepID=UPI0020327BB8|nr:dipeptidyl peptidase 9 [Plutella xylostella]
MEIVNMEVREAGDGAASGEYVPAPEKKYSWAEVRQAVHDLRKELSSLSTMVPMSISFRKLSNGKMRIYFLRTPQNGWEITLLYADVTPSPQPCTAKLPWHPFIESNLALGASGKWSREEQLLWERQRVAACGVASYELHRESGRVLLSCASSLLVATPNKEELHQTPLVPRVLPTGGGAPLTPAMCPHDPALVAHAARGDVWLCAGGTHSPTRLTYTEDPRQAGVPCYVTQEEFSRYTGFWWQPVRNDDVYRIVYEEVDESEVKLFSFPSAQSSSGDVEEFRFPRAGTPNAKSILRMATFRLQPTPHHEGGDANSSDSSTGWLEVTDIRTWDLRRSLQESFPWFEYLARVGWTPDGNYVWVQLLDRKQQRLELVLIPLEQFSEEFHYEHAPATEGAGGSVNVNCVGDGVRSEQVLITETAPNAWINVHDILHFLPSPPGMMRLLWASESTGHLHLYLYTCRLRDNSNMSDTGVVQMVTEDCGLASDVVSRSAVTAGEWEMLGRHIWVDETRKLVYFVGLRETPLEKHLYVASYDPPQPDNVTLLTTVGHSCTVDMDEDCTYAVITSSNISTLPTTRVCRVLQPPALLLQATLLDSAPESTSCSSNGSRESSRSADGDDDCIETSRLIKENSLSVLDIPPPQIYACRLSCGAVAYCTLWRGARPGRRPTVLHVYGGPEVQTVTNSYKGIRQLRMHMLAARGFSVVSIDSRGSKHRGRAWEAVIRGKLGQLELDDQVEVLQWLAKETGCIDMERVAIHGWSYGGYLSLLGIATRPNTFKLCIAGAPVTCWRLYDTAYTERYMGAPHAAPHAYARASVLAHAPFFPDQEGRLLIIHGLADENVHFCHTTALLAELVRLGKPHRVQIYPGERHSLRAMHAAKHYEAALLHFLHENL